MDKLEEFLKEEDTRTEENKSRAIEICNRIISLELEKKALSDSIKELKNELKNDGVDIKAFNKALKHIKDELKTTPDVAFETDKLIEEIKSDTTVYGNIRELVEK